MYLEDTSSSDWNKGWPLRYQISGPGWTNLQRGRNYIFPNKGLSIWIIPRISFLLFLLNFFLSKHMTLNVYQTLTLLLHQQHCPHRAETYFQMYKLLIYVPLYSLFLFISIPGLCIKQFTNVFQSKNTDITSPNTKLF